MTKLTDILSGNNNQVVGNGVTQSMIDKNALNIANKWFSITNNGFNELRESVYQARFIGRLPYAVVFKEQSSF